ncbi:hypothetical protein [Actinacidiphila acidipaludis]|uniref:DUF1449 family protein n=1 Tax=Actinacidiphila acidipaludis TaxID=2873382 RepID=A0ABS7Q703_9ACTN|nr:hypothetical protein [Streptomyces acidipaludis]MBY8878921.1 hypothetical protein [Streptomyces acidipaludis]
MGEFTAVVLGFPTVLFGGAMLVVVAFWGLVLLGGADAHGPGHHGHLGSHHAGPHPASGRGTGSPANGPHANGSHHAGPRGSLTAATGLDGVPVTIVLSLLVTYAWFLSLTGSVAVDGAVPHGLARTALDVAVLGAALVGSWFLTWLSVRPLRRLFPDRRPPSREDFVGRLCTVRTGRVTGAFGQAEVAAPDGSTAVVQVRQSGEERLAAGSSALLYAYEPEGEFFWVAPFGDPLGSPPTGPLDGPAVL